MRITQERLDVKQCGMLEIRKLSKQKDPARQRPDMARPESSCSGLLSVFSCFRRLAMKIVNAEELHAQELAGAVKIESKIHMCNRGATGAIFLERIRDHKPVPAFPKRLDLRR